MSVLPQDVQNAIAENAIAGLEDYATRVSTAARDGIEACAPSDVTESAAAAFANRNACSIG